jgi:formylglycine-generating enzyme required for sulfatase activity
VARARRRATGVTPHRRAPASPVSGKALTSGVIYHGRLDRRSFRSARCLTGAAWRRRGVQLSGEPRESPLESSVVRGNLPARLGRCWPFRIAATSLACLAAACAAAPQDRPASRSAKETAEARHALPDPSAPDPRTPRRPLHHDLVAIPAACFRMGADDGDFDERPPHDVCLSAFSIDRVEVANAAYQACVAARECRPAASYPRRPVLATPSHPVVGVGWVDADRYCRWAGMRLPSDAEWELAAAGTDGRRFPWGDEPPTCDRAVFAGCLPYSTVPVDSYPAGASPYGVLHMGGNAWEWVVDWWSSAYYRQSPRLDPLGPLRGRMRSLRGGCWNRTPWHLRVADRDSGVVGLRNDHVGFRCACRECAGPHARSTVEGGRR